MLEIWREVFEGYQGRTPKGTRRSSTWHIHRDAWIKAHGECLACTSRKGLQVHHIVPFWVDRTLEEDVRNFVTLCTKGKYGMKNCHLNIGHNGCYRRVNIRAVEDALEMRYRLTGERIMRAS